MGRQPPSEGLQAAAPHAIARASGKTADTTRPRSARRPRRWGGTRGYGRAPSEPPPDRRAAARGSESGATRLPPPRRGRRAPPRLWVEAQTGRGGGDATGAAGGDPLTVEPASSATSCAWKGLTRRAKSGLPASVHEVGGAEELSMKCTTAAPSGSAGSES